MSDSEQFGAATKTLEERILVMTGVQDNFNLKQVRQFAYKYRDWVFENLPNNLRKGAIQWQNMYESDRKKHMRALPYFLSEFRGADVRGVHFKSSDPQDPKTMASSRAGKFTVYDNLLMTDDYNAIMAILGGHEMTHLFQDCYQTTLPKHVVDLCNQFYVQPFENWDLYQKNPVEREANVVEEIMGYNFIRDLTR